MRTALVTAACLLLAGAPASAGELRPEPRFEHLTAADGLPENNVTAVLQDRLGFLWIGTSNGLVRWDGYTFVTYKPDPDDPGSPVGRHVTVLYEDSAGELWIGFHRGGLARYDRAGDRFEAIVHDPEDPASLAFDAVTAILEDRDGNFWVGTGDPEAPATGGGLARLDRATGRFTHYRHDPDDPSSLAADVVNHLHQDSAGRLWIATWGGGLDRFDPRSGAFVHHRHDPDDPTSLASDRVTRVADDGAGGLWVATWDAGLDRFDPETGVFTHHPSDPDDPTTPGAGPIMALHRDARGALWIGSCGDPPLVRRDPSPEPGGDGTAGGFTRFRHDPRNPWSPARAVCVMAVAEDRTGILWLATWGGGLDKLDRAADRFLHLPLANSGGDADEGAANASQVLALHRDRDGALWAGTMGGLVRYRPESGERSRFRHRSEDPGSLSANQVFALEEGAAGELWIGTARGLDRYDPATGSFVHLPLGISDGDTEPLSGKVSTAVRALLEDRRGKLWIGVQGLGLVRFDPESGERIRYRHDAEDPRSLIQDWVLALYEDRRGNLWVGTWGGISRYHPESDDFTSHNGPRRGDARRGLDTVFAFHEDRAGRFWIGSWTGGLHLFDRESGTSRAFTERDGLLHDTIYSIVEDDRGRLWLGTGKGLARFDPETGASRGFDTRDGLRGDLLAGGGLRGPEGALLFGSDRGVEVFFPELGAGGGPPPQVALTDFQVFNRPVTPGPGSPLGAHVSVVEEIRIAHDQNVVSFGFAALHFRNPARHRYAYRLDPFDPGWNRVGDRRRATYTNLAPGRYTFRVKGATADGATADGATADGTTAGDGWSEEATVRLVVEPPWWRSAWAYLLFGLSFVAGLVVFDRVQRARLVRRERQKAAQREAVLRAEAAELQARAAEAQAAVLQAENDRKSRELEAARQLQLSMLPRKVPWHPGVEIAARMSTATEVGGDYYDFDIADDGTLTLVLGDATGHGTRAGTIVAATKSLFHLLSRQGDVVELLTRASFAFRRMSLEKLYMALAVARLHEGRLELSSAGMPPAFVYRAAAGTVEEVALPGMPLGGIVRYPYRKARLDLAPDDVVVMMSDGLPETLDSRGDPFGYERIAAALPGFAGCSPREIVDHLFGLERRWRGDLPRADDVTFLVLKATPGESSG